MDIENSKGCLSDLPSFPEILHEANEQRKDQLLLEAYTSNSGLVLIKKIPPKLQYLWNLHQLLQRMLWGDGYKFEGIPDPVALINAHRTFNKITKYLVEEFTAMAKGKKFDEYVVKTGWQLLGVPEESYKKIMTNWETFTAVTPTQKRLH